MIKKPGKINYSRHFQKQLEKYPLKIKVAFRARREIFEEDPFPPLLNNHLLTGRFVGYRSININGDWRAIYLEHRNEKGEKVLIFEGIGTHSQLYR